MPRVRTPAVGILAAATALTLMGGWGSINAGDEAVDGDPQPVTIQLVASTHVQGAYKPCT